MINIVNKKTLFSTALVVGAFGVAGFFASSDVMASEVVDQVTGNDGDVKDLLKVNAEVTSVDGSQVTFKDSETGEVYEASFGPSWFSDEYEVGSEVVVVGVETEEGNNENGHNFQVMKVNETELRTEFEGKPEWAGQGRGGNGDGTGAGAGGQMRHSGNGGGTGADFVDADGDGVCDNA